MKILLADDDHERAHKLAREITRHAAVEVVFLERNVMLADGVAQYRPDVVLVDMIRPDRDALDAVRLVSHRIPHPVVLFIDEDDPKFMEEAIAAGICSYNVGSVMPSDVKPILRAAVAFFRHQQTTRAALNEANARLRERETIDQAKSRLMRERRFSEPEAHRYLQRQAMSTGRKLLDVAQSLLSNVAEGGRG